MLESRPRAALQARPGRTSFSGANGSTLDYAVSAQPDHRGRFLVSIQSAAPGRQSGRAARNHPTCLMSCSRICLAGVVQSATASSRHCSLG